MFKVLKSTGVELTRYHHGGSLNGKDTKTVTHNASYVFDEWPKILKCVLLIVPIGLVQEGAADQSWGEVPASDCCCSRQ